MKIWVILVTLSCTQTLTLPTVSSSNSDLYSKSSDSISETPHPDSPKEKRTRRKREGRFYDLKSLFSAEKRKAIPSKVTSISEMVATNENAITLRIMCETLGGTIVGEECLDYVDDAPSNFIEARNACKEKGGDLYVPSKHEGFFFPKYFLYFPQAFKEDSRSLGWIGALRGGAGAPVLTVDGQDVTTDSIYNIYTLTGSQCLNLYIDKGNAFLRGEDCSQALPFTCEYIFDEEATKMIKEKSFVTKALTRSNKKYATIFHKFPFRIKL